jgi:hypothetical protein
VQARVLYGFAGNFNFVKMSNPTRIREFCRFLTDWLYPLNSWASRIDASVFRRIQSPALPQQKCYRLG